ncbi:MAG: exosortase [Flavobacteriales bacterium 32-35-8]|nr:MAG: exosortase [Flavobacteriales bacterium 32-35-8]
MYEWIAHINDNVGSVLTHVKNKCIIWGSGIISKDYSVKKANFLAVRGPQTRKFLLNLGYEVPEVYGDPALLLPKYYNPKVDKEYKIGIVPHYRDFTTVKDLYKNEPSILLIDLMTNDIEETTSQFLKCEKIISSSLHGIIVAHAYGIPSVWQKFSDKVFGDDIKYKDYFESVSMPFYQSDIKNEKMRFEDLDNLFHNKETLPKLERIDELCNGLMAVCPFKN